MRVFGLRGDIHRLRLHFIVCGIRSLLTSPAPFILAKLFLCIGFHCPEVKKLREMAASTFTKKDSLHSTCHAGLVIGLVIRTWFILGPHPLRLPQEWRKQLGIWNAN
jgi:hypothetical protein